MKKTRSRFLVSKGDSNHEYGLFIIEVDDPLKEENVILTYCFDFDDFSSWPAKDVSLFVTPSELLSCKDEFGNEYRNQALGDRIKQGIRAYKEELPGYMEYLADFNQRLAGCE